MKILSISITNFRGISDTTTISFNDFCCIVGKNDAGKSTILKALDLFLNESVIRKEDKNIHTQNYIIAIELVFETPKTPIIVDDAIETTFKEENLVDRDGHIRIKKNGTPLSVKSNQRHLFAEENMTPLILSKVQKKNL